MPMIIILVIIIVFFFIGLNIYNGLVGLRNQLERAWSNIDVILKQRSDEIPQLVQVIEQYANYESRVLKKLSDARSQYGSAKTIDEKMDSSNNMSLALKGIFAIGESYPVLQSNQNFKELQTRVSQLESTLADRREVYNEAVANFNTRIDQFPDVLAARILNYQRQKMFQVQDSEKAMPSLKMKIPQ